MTGACPARSERGEGRDEPGPGATPGPGLAGWLALAATPTFAAMALLTAASGGGAEDVLCQGGQGSALGGMVAMYLLMSAFHAAPWLTLLRRRRAPATGV